MAKKEIAIAEIIDEQEKTVAPAKKTRAPKGDSVAALKRQIAVLELQVDDAKSVAQRAFAKADEAERELKQVRLHYTRVMGFIDAQVNGVASAVNLALKGEF